MDRPFFVSRSVATRLTILFLCAAASVRSSAQGPTIESIGPSGGQRGTDFTAAIIGERLDTVEDILFYRSGVELLKWKAINEDEAEATFRATADCTLGDHPFWLTGAQGVSGAGLLRVGPFPVADESEPNDSTQEADRPQQKIDGSSVTLTGAVEAADVDCYRFDLRRGQRLSAQVDAMRLAILFRQKTSPRRSTASSASTQQKNS